MCMADGADMAEFFRSTKQKARKAHQCDECRRTIEPGETYERHFGIYEGESFTGKTCAHCAVLVDWLTENCGGVLYHAVIEDVEEHVRDYRRMDLARLVVAAKNDWRSVRRKVRLPIPALPRPIKLGDAR